ncbi:MAG: hypothetical protein IPM29_17600 [Planctomycetes bacterium]|nr:hypothetical protein [Planctomycetota bacterium]
MSIIRLSVIQETPYAPTPDGVLVHDAYQRRRRQGKLEALRRPGFANKTSDFAHYIETQVAAEAAKLERGAPVVFMVHGFLFDPKAGVSPEPSDTDNPHSRVYHFQVGDAAHEQRHHTTSWPHWLGFESGDAGEHGVAVAFGWHSAPGLASSIIAHFKNFYSRAYGFAEQSAWVFLATLESAARTAALAGHPFDVFCHSLGSRIVVRALAMAAEAGHRELIGRLRRIVILGGAEYVVEAQLMMQRLLRLADSDPSGATRLPSFYNVVSRENDVLDVLAENFGPRTFGNSQVIGHNGLDTGSRAPNWIDLQIDRPELQRWMAECHGIRISGDRPDNVWDHWYYYTYRGNMELYRRILREDEPWRIETLRRTDTRPPIPEGVPRRWWNFGD